MKKKKKAAKKRGATRKKKAAPRAEPVSRAAPKKRLSKKAPRKKPTVASLRTAARLLLETQLGKWEVRKFKTKGVVKKRKIAKEIQKTKAEIKALMPKK